MENFIFPLMENFTVKITFDSFLFQNNYEYNTQKNLKLRVEIIILIDIKVEKGTLQAEVVISCKIRKSLKVRIDVIHQSGTKVIALKLFAKQWSFFERNSKIILQLQAATHADLKYGLLTQSQKISEQFLLLETQIISRYG